MNGDDTMLTARRAARMMALFGLAVVLAAPAGAGCARRTTTVKTETVQPAAPAAEGTTTPAVAAPATKTTTETTETTSDSGGVVSSTIDVVGEVLALPFRLIAGLITFIF